MDFFQMPAGFAPAVKDMLSVALSSPQHFFAGLAAVAGVVFIVWAAMVRALMPLRWLTFASNVGLAIFGLLHPSFMTFLVAAALLPIDLYRALEITRQSRRIKFAENHIDPAGLWLKPFMYQSTLQAGQTLFHRGDRAQMMYLLVEGEMELVELGKAVPTGHVFGEIALFSVDRQRTVTVRCVTRCVVLEIHDSALKQLCLQSPELSFHLLQLIASRFSASAVAVPAPSVVEQTVISTSLV